MSHDLDELLAAYIDGTASDAERARVEADPALVAEVERLRQLIAALHEPEPPRHAARESAIAAALAVFDTELVPGALVPGTPDTGAFGTALDAGMPADPAATTSSPDTVATAPVVSLDRRRRRVNWSSGLGIAAATVAVVGIGVVVSQRSALAPVADDAPAAVYTEARAADGADRPDPPAASSSTPLPTAGTDSTPDDGPTTAPRAPVQPAPEEPAPEEQSADVAETAEEPAPAPPLAAVPRPADSERAVVTTPSEVPLGDAVAPFDAAAAAHAGAAADGLLWIHPGDDLTELLTDNVELVSRTFGETTLRENAAHRDDAVLRDVDRSSEADAGPPVAGDALALLADLDGVERACREAAGLEPRPADATIPVMTAPRVTARPSATATAAATTTTGPGVDVMAGAGGRADAVYVTLDGRLLDVYLARDADGQPLLLDAVSCAIVVVEAAAAELPAR